MSSVENIKDQKGAQKLADIRVQARVLIDAAVEEFRMWLTGKLVVPDRDVVLSEDQVRRNLEFAIAKNCYEKHLSLSNYWRALAAEWNLSKKKLRGEENGSK